MSSKSRQSLLDTLRKQSIESVPLPEVIQGNWIEYPDPIAQLASVIQSVGGSCETLPDIEAVRSRIMGYPEMQGAGRVLSLVPGIENHVDLESIQSPRELEDLDFVIVPGEIAVAENGAVWVTDQGLKHRVVYFINQHLIIVVRRSAIVHNMHEAYARLNLGTAMFGCFISGPSKTADIEQSLVIGAHGCCSMQLYVIDSLVADDASLRGDTSETAVTSNVIH